MTDAFDQTTLLDRLDGDLEFLHETVQMLDEDGPELLDQIDQAAASRDAQALATAAHTLKGMVANFCADPAETAARELETMARQEQLSEVDKAITNVKRETERLREALQDFLRANTQ